MSSPGNLDDLSPAELKALVIRLMSDITELQRVIEDQRAEIVRLKGLKGRPRLKPSKPSGMEEASLSKPTHPRRRGRGHQTRVAVEEEMIPVAVPAGSRFKGYEDYVVQELEIRPRVIRYRRERWLTPDGRAVVAPLPAGICGHFGPNLRRFVLAQCHQGQVTVPRLVVQLRDFGLAVSKRQLVRLLTARQEPFLVEARDVLRAGLTSAAWLAVDDTGARHKAQNGFCTQIGNDRFAWFGKCICSRVGQPQRVVQFAIGKQSSIGGNRRTAKLEHQATIKIEPQRTSIRFTRRVRHYYPGVPSITR
jgi:hypothetical protein